MTPPLVIKGCSSSVQHGLSHINRSQRLFGSIKYRNLFAQRLSGLVQIPTVTYDEMGLVGEDSRWNVFYRLPKYLKKIFPRIYQDLEVVTINEHAFLYTWTGSDASLKPLMFMAHTDVVPAPEATSDRWTYPPFSGHYDGDFIWGRGSEDDKSNIIAILSAIDALLKVGFKPQRTVVFAVGFDEEGSAPGGYGARCLAEQLLETYGEDGVELIFDEGIPGIEKHFGTEFAMPAAAEKGYLDVVLTINTAGGHSSTPPDHTAIGYLARIIQAIEDHPFQSRLTSANPTSYYLKTIALHAKDIPSDLQKAILDPKSADRVLEYMNSSLDSRALVRTSTAVDIIQGGEKSNVLPETAHIIVNHRIAVEESVQTVKDYYIRLLSPLAKKWDYGIQGFGQNAASNTRGTITLAGYSALEPSPTSDVEDKRFKWLVESIGHVFGKDVIVAPVLLTGNTDTKFYWRLSSQIYRWSPWRASLDPRGSMMHTVDERMPVDGLLEMVRFYHEFIRVVDAKRR
ncbi:Gly-Xaa carboxypeptidase [Rhexocercosporidium sp. MPI-PUGE-AT-0058]|nr:Gly-Xaa carboxypeptidase [Rhexocercosporidium sp. MPI-PUGE-AT-0058]